MIYIINKIKTNICFLNICLKKEKTKTYNNLFNKFGNAIKSLSEIEEQVLKEEVLTLKDYQGFKITSKFLIRFTANQCVAIAYEDISKALCKYQSGDSKSRGGYVLTIFDEKFHKLGKFLINSNGENVKNDIIIVLASLKFKCNSISIEYKNDLFEIDKQYQKLKYGENYMPLNKGWKNGTRGNEFNKINKPLI